MRRRADQSAQLLRRDRSATDLLGRLRMRPNRELGFSWRRRGRRSYLVLKSARGAVSWRCSCLEESVMSRLMCLALALSALAAAPGCSSCFGGGGAGCRRPSFMEFRGGCGRRGEACPPPMMAPPCAPACDPCGSPCGQSMGPSMGPAPCCGDGNMQDGGMMMPSSPMPSAPQGTFS